MNIITPWDKNKRPYYHFTSLDSFCKIFETGKLRLTSCNLAKNAPVEIMALYSSVKTIIDNDENLKWDLLQRYSCSGNEDLINCIIEQRNRSYIACFSMFDHNNDIDEISRASYMWKFYADDNKGVVIKFNYECFPYMNTSSSSDNNLRISEPRIDHAIYDQNILNNWLRNPIDVHLFATDVYKPKSCELENEIRFLVHLFNRNDLYKLDGISEIGARNSELPDFLYYDFASKKEIFAPCIEKVFCRDSATFGRLCNMLDRGLIELIG